MLKALELSGFKSFADRTRFEFPSGITVVVGPNGSGKSNIVDAIKWVLGEQSARSLRGKEMADVIFKGSGNGNRRPGNTAEATIIFDNASGLIDIDATEVHITRRVYRSGEGEYQINGQACRLRDIKDLFRGTGVGADAYSIIEQGKVDTLLQASAKDRRAIFEEAAGISRFKAKKVETQRRLERVDQNLVRLNDIVEEVDHRLRRLKSQATKARRYQEYTQRLQSLRTHVGRVDWQRLSNDLQGTESQLGTVQSELADSTTTLEALEASRIAYDEQIHAIEESLSQTEATLSRNRETLSTYQATVGLENARVSEIDEQMARCRRQMLAMHARTGGLSTHIKDLESALAAITAEHESNVEILDEEEKKLDGIDGQLSGLREKSDSERRDYSRQMRIVAELANQIAGHQSTVVASEDSLARGRKALEKLTPLLEKAGAKSESLAEQQSALEQTFAQQAAALNELREQRTQQRLARKRLQKKLRDNRDERVAAGERRKLLEEFEERLEGINAGVKEVLREAKEDPEGPFGGIRGMVADLINVSQTEKAPLVGAALGERAQHIVVAGSRFLQHLQAREYSLTGRVGFMRLESTPPASASHDVDLRGQSGIVGRCDDFVVAEEEYSHLISWLLADTWFVETLDDAIQFRNSIRTPVRFVTAKGELVERDGRIFVGTLDGAMGVISRRAELRAVHQRLERLDEETAELEKAIADADAELREDEQKSVALSKDHDETGQSLAKVRAQSEAAQERVDQLTQQQQQAQSDLEAIGSSISATRSRLEADLSRRSELDGILSALEATLDDARGQLQALEEKQQDQRKIVTSARVVVAKSEQRVDVLQAQLDQVQRDQAERDKAKADARDELGRLQERLTASQREALKATARLSELFLVDESAGRERRAERTQRQELRRERSKLDSQLVGLRQKIQALQEQQHQHQLNAEKIRLERTTLADRIRDDYGLEIAEMELAMSAVDPAEFEDADAEITALRRKLSNIGSVNMDALSELEDLAQRHASLDGQLQDLLEAKKDLERIIERINSDSRRLFAETLEVIRTNFSALFRKLFGGGNADIVLEEGVDLLEAGIDIVATPPGKQSLGLSLLSGGERALTAVTLLLAIFQYRPSPFCVLDEVDGPLDEANVGRFTDILNEFLKWTKFVVVTHSKKTMTVAHTLYGVTMQESGVSKRVSVQFEDVSEDGHIDQAAVDREQDRVAADHANEDHAGDRDSNDGVKAAAGPDVSTIRDDDSTVGEPSEPSDRNADADNDRGAA